jgi:hypothetical protein
VEPVVVAGVADDHDIGGVDDLQEAGQEAGGADSACQGDDHGQQGSGGHSRSAS